MTMTQVCAFLGETQTECMKPLNERFKEMILVPDNENKPERILTYFVNSIRFNNRITPYSFVSSSEKQTKILNIQDDEIIITDWLAEDLGSREGDLISIFYFIQEENRQFSEAKMDFKIKRIIQLSDEIINKARKALDRMLEFS